MKIKERMKKNKKKKKIRKKRINLRERMPSPLPEVNKSPTVKTNDVPIISSIKSKHKYHIINITSQMFEFLLFEVLYPLIFFFQNAIML